jgi:hypothetical protein
MKTFLEQFMEESNQSKIDSLTRQNKELRERLLELWYHVKLNNEDASTGNYHKDSVFGKVENILNETA